MNKNIKLSFINELHRRLNANAGVIQVVLGPRQVGKTTGVLDLIANHFQEKAYYVSADAIFNSDVGWLRKQWLIAKQERKILFVDEIQKCFNWAEGIKVLHDEAKRLGEVVPCILLGSSSLEIQKGLTESLTGRFQLTRAHHWNFSESQRGYDLSLDDFLFYGGYPGSYTLIRSNDWRDYVKNSIITSVVEKDILQYHTVKNPSLFRQAFDLIVSYPAQEISYTKLLGQLQDKGNVELIKNYISLYEGAYLIKILEKFSTKPLTRKSSSPKIIPLAPCLASLHYDTPASPEQQGRIFESVVGAQLLRTGESVYYWRELTHEVDYVVKKGSNLWAIEVKSGNKKSPRGLEMFCKKFPGAKAVIITPENYLLFEQDPLDFLASI